MAPARPKPKPGRTSPAQTKTLGAAEKGSRQKAESAVTRNDAQATDTGWPTLPNGKPMAKIEFAVSELIPTGNYANVTIGPYRVTMFVDPDAAEIDEDTLDGLAAQANQLAESSMSEVMGVQRALVLESLNMNQEAE
jgi:hypothetical protein